MTSFGFEKSTLLTPRELAPGIIEVIGDKSSYLNIQMAVAKDYDINPSQTRIEISPYEIDSSSIEKVQNIPLLKKLMRVCRVDRLEDIGQEMPMASVNLMDNSNEIGQGLFDADFGRDSILTAQMLLPAFPKLARRVILSLGSRQCLENMPTSNRSDGLHESGNDGFEGGILHEDRRPGQTNYEELTEKGWRFPYFGSIDSTLLYVRLVNDYINHVGSDEILDELVDDNSERTVRDVLSLNAKWIFDRIASSPDGLIEFKSQLEFGILNQAWKDSYDSYHHKDGTLANHEDGIASIEVQGYAVDALLTISELFSEINPAMATQAKNEAETLRCKIFDLFYVEKDDDDYGYFALGFDRDPETKQLRRLEVKTSNMGQLLNTRIAENATNDQSRKINETIETLSSPVMSSPSGIRTLASDEVRFSSGAYHNGSAWPHVVREIALGMKKQGKDLNSTDESRVKQIECSAKADDLNSKLWSIYEITGLCPEFMRTDENGAVAFNTLKVQLLDYMGRALNTIEQMPQLVQAWVIASFVSIAHEYGLYSYLVEELESYELEEELQAV